MRALVSSLVAMLLGAGCTDDGDPSIHAAPLDASMDARVTTLDGGRDGAQQAPRDARTTLEPACPKVDGPCRGDAYPWRVLLDAGDFGPNASFTALGGGAVLLQHDKGYEVLSVARRGTPPSLQRWRFPGGAWRPLDVVDAEEQGAPVWVLACNDDAGQCSLLRGARDAAMLSVQEPGVPLADPRGLVLLSARMRAPCVYGDGVACLIEGAWKGLLQGVAVAALHPGNMRVDHALAVGEDGSVWLAAYDDDGGVGNFARHGERIEGELRSTDAADLRAVLATTTGLYRLAADATGAYCPLHGVLAAFRFSGALDQSVLYEDGRRHSTYYADRQRGWCELPRISWHGDIVETGTAYCVQSANERVLTTQQLWGHNDCAVFVGP
jgi:hypothetical protein